MISTCRKCSISLGMICLPLLVSGCITIFSELQSAKLAGPSRAEVTPGYSQVWFSDDDSEQVSDQLGFRLGFGLADGVDMRMRIEHVFIEDFRDWNLAGFGPKFSLVKDKFAFFIPLGFVFGEDIDTEDSLEIQPTVILTLPASKELELNTSGKLIFDLDDLDNDVLVAFNFGFGISGDLDKYAIRPEIGFLLNPGEEGYFFHFSIAFTKFFETNNKPDDSTNK